MVCLLIDVAYLVAFVLMLPIVLYRMLCHGRYRFGWHERFGYVPLRHSEKHCVWIHAVSMGEINAISTLVEGLAGELPGYELIISSTTDTGMARARKLYGDKYRVFFFPYDFSWVVSRAFGRLKPDLCILMEGEVWPNFTAIASKRSVPVVVANGRVGGAKGWPRYRLVAPLVRGMFSRLSLVLAQDDVSAERFEYLGVASESIRVVGTLKYDTAELCDKVAGTDELERELSLLAGESVWVAGQTAPGEEEIVLDCYGRLRKLNGLKELRLAIVPRKPERFDEVASLIGSYGYNLIRYSMVKGLSKASQADGIAVILGDTMGDLRKFYSLADAVFVGRSLVNMGGSDMMEVAALGKAVVVGPHTDNFTATVEVLSASGGLVVAQDSSELVKVTGELLCDRARAISMGLKAREVIVANKGATERTVSAIVELLG